MKLCQYEYLSKNMPVVVNKTLSKDYYGNSIPTIKKGTEIKFHYYDREDGPDKFADFMVEYENEIKVICLPFQYIDLKPAYVPFISKTKLKKPKKSILTYKVGEKFIYYCYGFTHLIGNLQIVEIIKRHNEGSNDTLTFKDQFGNIREYDNERDQLYVLDENQKYMYLPEDILNPIEKIPEEEIIISKKDLEKFAILLRKKLKEENEAAYDLDDDDVFHGLCESFAEYLMKN